MPPSDIHPSLADEGQWALVLWWRCVIKSAHSLKPSIFYGLNEIHPAHGSLRRLRLTPSRTADVEYYLAPFSFRVKDATGCRVTHVGRCRINNNNMAEVHILDFRELHRASSQVLHKESWWLCAFSECATVITADEWEQSCTLKVTEDDRWDSVNERRMLTGINIKSLLSNLFLLHYIFMNN